MACKPWHKVATPREDLRERKPLDASEFAVYLNGVPYKCLLRSRYSHMADGDRTLSFVGGKA
jgi:hypothetical protein